MILLVMVFRQRFRNQNAIRPVNRIKHVVDSQDGVGLNTQLIKTIANAVDTPNPTLTNEVFFGSTINGIYIVCEINATTSAALPNAYFMVVKNPGGNLTFPNANVVGADDNKRYVIHQEMVMLQGQSGSNPRTLFKGVVVIPRGYRRMAIGDLIQIMVFAPGVNTNVCIQTHYKEFR